MKKYQFLTKKINGKKKKLGEQEEVYEALFCFLYGPRIAD